MSIEKKIMEIVKTYGEDDSVGKILHAPDNLFMRKSGRKWHLLYIGVYKQERTNEETLQFYMVEDETEHTYFFSWSELREELKVNITHWIDSFNK